MRDYAGIKSLLDITSWIEPQVANLRQLGKSVLDAPSVILTRQFHQQVTNNLFRLLPKGVRYTEAQIRSAYRQAYKDFPDWIKAADDYLGF